MLSLKGKKAVVTGGGSGIGKAVSVVFAKQGAEVCILELNADHAATIVEEIKAQGGKATVYACDVSNQ